MSKTCCWRKKKLLLEIFHITYIYDLKGAAAAPFTAIFPMDSKERLNHPLSGKSVSL